MPARGRQMLASAMALLVACVALPAAAQTPRDLIFQSAFGTQSQPVALERVRRAFAIASAASQRDPANEEATVIAAAAQGYIAKLTGSRAEALKARRQFDAAATRFPRNAEAQLGIGAWHLAVVHRIGRLLGAVIGASKGRGLAGLSRGVALGRDRAFAPGIAGMMLVEADPDDPQGRAWLEQAARAEAPSVPDRIIQRAAAQVAALLRAGNGKAAQALADRSLPFGWFQPGS